MSSSHEPIYWDTAAFTLADPGAPGAVTTYSLGFPQGTTRWRIFNLSTTHNPEVAGTFATIQLANGPLGIPTLVAGSTWNMLDGTAQGVFIRNRNNGQTIATSIMWERVGRQPDMDAGVVTISANLTP